MFHDHRNEVEEDWRYALTRGRSNEPVFARVQGRWLGLVLWDHAPLDLVGRWSAARIQMRIPGPPHVNEVSNMSAAVTQSEVERGSPVHKVYGGTQCPPAQLWVPFEWDEPRRGRQVHGEIAV